jgi:hypothetical protein
MGRLEWMGRLDRGSIPLGGLSGCRPIGRIVIFCFQFFNFFGELILAI